LPLDALREHLHELDAGKETIVYCRVGLRGYLAARILQQHGFARVRNLTGGLLMCPPASRAAALPALAGNQSTVSVAACRKAIDEGAGVIIDVRELDEFEYENILGSRNLPLSNLTRAVPAAPGP
ncbi:MAG: hypothetical protein HYU33_07105, partial [Candidatus Omnitrophica bacterium]|nr:hypothetical protein [Candidatus Omnitrophota bacterium]